MYKINDYVELIEDIKYVGIVTHISQDGKYLAIKWCNGYDGTVYHGSGVAIEYVRKTRPNIFVRMKLL